MYNQIKNAANVKPCSEYLGLDELYWFIERKPNSKACENVYIMIAVSREPRQIVGFDVVFDKSPLRIQDIVDAASPANFYCTDGCTGYIDVVYPGSHLRNVSK